MTYTAPASTVREQQIEAPMLYTAAMLEHMVYGDVKYSRDLENENDGAHYWRAPRGSGLPDLHRCIYEEHHGPIPEGYHVHHVDFDCTNNDPSNLVALTPSDHRKVHPGFDNRSPEHLAFLDSIRAASHESAKRNGHYSKAAKKFWASMTPEERSAVQRERWTKVETKVKPCVVCGKNFTYKRRDAECCSQTCRNAKPRSN